jgi:Putative Flp pilus-assembly TadE/G-like
MNAARKPPVGGREGGQMIVVFAIVLLVLLGFAALGIDVGYMYSVRNDLQRSVDSGALAGAFAFHDGGWVSGSVPALLKAKAENRATFFATRDPVGPAPLNNGDISFNYTGVVNQIQVTAQYNANLFFAGIIGSPTVLLSATAVAEAIPVDQNIECLTPLAFPYPYTDSNGDGDWDSGEPVVPPSSIPQGTRVTFHVANTESPISNYVRFGMLAGGTLRGGAGEIFPTRMCGDSSGGESDLRLRIRTPCYDGCNAISIGDTISLKDNPTYIPAIDEIQDELINNDPSGAWGGGPSNLPVSPDPAYSGDNWLLSPRVVRVMLYNPQEARATGNITVRGFAGFWIESVSGSPSWPNNANLTGYFVPDSAVGGTSSSPVLIEPSLKTTRLVQ